MSVTEAEYIAASEAAMEIVWIKKFISGLGIVPTINEPIKMFCDNSAALLIANEPGPSEDIGLSYVKTKVACMACRMHAWHEGMLTLHCRACMHAWQDACMEGIDMAACMACLT
ncbi:hypothetical protein Tco_0743132 [Tanacetum coccineum]